MASGSVFDLSWIQGRSYRKALDLALTALASLDEVDRVINAVVGAAGLPATLAALARGRTLALANKESLVSGGHLVMPLAKAAARSPVPLPARAAGDREQSAGARLGGTLPHGARVPGGLAGVSRAKIFAAAGNACRCGGSI